jgi:uncharacterized membrane protein
MPVGRITGGIRLFEVLIFILVVGLVLAIPVVALVLAAVALARSGRIKGLEQRVRELEQQLGRPEVPPAAIEPTAALPPEEVADAEVVTPFAAASSEPEEVRGDSWQLEMLIGQKAFGWIAVVLSIFAAAFFLKYAYDNNWIGPLGRVAIGMAAGCALMIAGWRYHVRGWSVFSQMLSACGVVVLYLATYSAFGFYQLLPLHEAGIFLTVVIVLSMLVAALYDSPAIAFMAVVGGLLTPVLLSSERDAYVSLFTYLGALNLGVAILVSRRGWPAMGSVALLGTQLLFWLWYDNYYHPDKLAWVLGFQIAIFTIYLAQDLLVQFRYGLGNRWESSIRMVMNAAFWFTAFYILLEYDYGAWMGTAALAMASVYGLIARLLLSHQGRYTIELLTAIALAVGFITLAIPLEADARWVALGWAACAGVLGWFGVRVQAAPLRGLAVGLAIASLIRLIAVDLLSYPDEWLIPLANEIALPCLAVTICLLVAVVAMRRYRGAISPGEYAVVGLFGLLVLVVLWVVLSVDVYHFFHMQRRLADSDVVDWRRIGQMSLSVLWTVYASALLAAGFKWRLIPVRWLAIGFFALTVGKVFLLDMAGLSEIYRIVAFIVLALFLGVAARVYQRVGSGRDSGGSGEANSHVSS